MVLTSRILPPPHQAAAQHEAGAALRVADHSAHPAPHHCYQQLGVNVMDQATAVMNIGPLAHTRIRARYVIAESWAA